MPSIEFAKKVLGIGRDENVTNVIASATTDSENGHLTVAVGEAITDPDGNPVPEFDEFGNETGRTMDNLTEVPTVGSASNGDALNMVNGVGMGVVGGGDEQDENTADAARTATDYIYEKEDGSIMLGYGDTITICDSEGNRLASFSDDGVRVYVMNKETMHLYEEGIVGSNALTNAEIGRVSFINGVDVTPSKGNLFIVHGESEFSQAVSMPKKIQAGTVPVETVAASGMREVQVQFDYSFDEAPAIIVTLESPQTQYIGNCTAYAHNRTSTGFTLRIANNYTNTRSLGASWMAVAK